MPTSPIGKESPGFTLLEMLVVLTIIGLLSGLAIPLYFKSQARLQMWTSSHKLLLDLRRAHSEAKMGKKTVSIAFFPDQKAYALDGHKYPLSVDVAMTYEKSGQQISNLIPTINFYADGSATPASITLSNGNKSASFHVDGLTGQVGANAN